MSAEEDEEKEKQALESVMGFSGFGEPPLLARKIIRPHLTRLSLLLREKNGHEIRRREDVCRDAALCAGVHANYST